MKSVESRRALVEEDVRDPVEQLAAALERLEGVLEDRESRLRHDRLDLGELLGHPGLEGGLEVLVADLANGGSRVRQRARGEERVRHQPSTGERALGSPS